MTPSIPAADLDHILEHTALLWHELHGARLFITGGTGFWGKWLLESIAVANDRLDAKVSATLLSREPERFAREMPRLASRPEFAWLRGDAASFGFPDGHFDHVIHLATASAAEVGAGGTAPIIHTLAGTARTLDFAQHCGAQRFLLASSGAVYGRQPPEFSHIPESYAGAPVLREPQSAYGEVKRMSELMCAMTPGIECIIARGFAFVGPYLPLTDKFAVGGFIRDALAGGPIRIGGDGTPVRSYLYAADLAIWLLTLLVKGKPSEAYNVGSDETIQISRLAASIARTIGATNIETAHVPTNDPPQRYVPSIAKAGSELGLAVHVPLAAALSRTIEWARRC